MMRHAIIIPFRANGDRLRNLELCLSSLQQSAEECGINDWHALIVNNGDVVPFCTSAHASIVIDHRYMPIFCKPTLQNLGIAVTRDADVLSFLDADAIVSPRWMENVQRLVDEPTLTKLCYRVRRLPSEWCDSPYPFIDYDKQRLDDKSRLIDIYPLAHEGYGRPENIVPCGTPIFGNSQFSIRRDVLGDTRFDEHYIGRGWEDLWMNRELWMRNPIAYRAEIVTDGEHAMFHIQNTLGGPDWFNAKLNTDNARRYKESWKGMDKLLPIAA
jgi:hypothetical protein